MVDEARLKLLGQIYSVGDTTSEKGSHGSRDSQSSGEKLLRISSWIIANKDQDNLVDQLAFAAECTQLGLEPQKVVQMLKEEGRIFDVTKVGKFGVGG